MKNCKLILNTNNLISDENYFIFIEDFLRTIAGTNNLTENLIDSSQKNKIIVLEILISLDDNGRIRTNKNIIGVNNIKEIIFNKDPNFIYLHISLDFFINCMRHNNGTLYEFLRRNIKFQEDNAEPLNEPRFGFYVLSANTNTSHTTLTTNEANSFYYDWSHYGGSTDEASSS